MLTLNTNDTLNLKLSSDSLTLKLSSPNEMNLGVSIPERVYTSLYELAVQNGYEGTFEEWIATFGATITIGSISSGPISVTNSGTSKDAVLDFTLPDSIDLLSQDDVLVLDCGSATEVI